MEEELKKQQIEAEKLEQKERGLRIKSIRENELNMKKTELGRKIGISSQFLGLVEEGKGNLVYKSIKRLRNISGHSSDYILYGLDDNIISETKEYLKEFSDQEIIQAIEIIKQIALLIKNRK